MARMYSDQSYGARQNITLGPTNVGLTTAASATAVMGYRFMYPAKVVDANVQFLTAVAADLGTSTSWLLQKSTDAGTGMVAFGTAGVADDLATCTFAAGASLDMTVTETTFSAGDEVYLTVEGTVGELVGDIAINLETQENFEESDS